MMKLLLLAVSGVLLLSLEVCSLTVNIPGQGALLGSETLGAFTGKITLYNSRAFFNKYIAHRQDYLPVPWS